VLREIIKDQKEAINHVDEEILYRAIEASLATIED
jgi:hypothetical protein